MNARNLDPCYTHIKIMKKDSHFILFSGHQFLGLHHSHYLDSTVHSTSCYVLETIFIPYIHYIAQFCFMLKKFW